MKTLLKLLACAVFSLVAGLAFTQPSPPGDPDRADRGLKALGLTTEQVTQVRDLLEKGRAATRVQKANLDVLDAQIRAAMVVATPDLKVVNGLVDQKMALLGSLEKQRLAQEVQLRQLVGDPLFDRAHKALRTLDRVKLR